MRWQHTTRVSLFFSEAKDTAEMQLKKKNKKKNLLHVLVSVR